MNITINPEQRLFVFKHSEHVTCLGFDVVYNSCKELYRRIIQYKLLQPDQSPSPVEDQSVGTLQQYDQYANFLRIIGSRKIGTWFDYETPTKVRTVLERYRKDGGTLRIFYGDKKTGRCWLEEHDVVGQIGRSSGTLQATLLMSPSERFGSAILDSCIVRIIDADTRSELYRQKNYHLPEMEIRTADVAKSAYEVWTKEEDDNFQIQASFESYGKAAHYVAFMSGESTEQPQ